MLVCNFQKLFGEKKAHCDSRKRKILTSLPAIKKFNNSDFGEKKIFTELQNRMLAKYTYYLPT